MTENQIMILGEKETFLVRVLTNKLTAANMHNSFIHWDVDAIEKAWGNTCLVIGYLEDDERPSDEVLHYLNDKLGETGTHILLVGGRSELDYMCDWISGSLIHQTFTRPIDATEFVESVREVYEKVQAGEFRKSILVVDDDASYLGLVREWLKNTYRVSMVTSGLQAIKWLGKNKADLILLDHEMPVTSGPQVLEMLRSEEETKDIPVIFLTGKGDKESVMEVVALKPEGYFLKTIERQELIEKLREFFLRRQ